MTEDNRIAELTEIFRTLGADDAEYMARSEVEENTAQLARYLFLRSAWSCVISETDDAWIEEQLAYASRYPGAPGSAIGPALQRMLAQGVDRETIVDVVRGMQWHTLDCLLNLIDGTVEPDPGYMEMAWALMELGPDGHHTGRIVDSLHESILAMDPTGREMRPRA